ncbi:unnamed protein product [Prorocentrum cordatum]|uniref:Uncharacterized protein n=1 Tax=Prorocentrum cordatum TaxID=2364126 RepID=A0ABN9PYG6_9DINO|nr:unnamed protein product [Polarella glacialis]
MSQPALSTIPRFPDSTPRLAIVTFSDRHALANLSRPLLEQFVEAHPNRYDLLLHEEPLLDRQDFHPAWEKLAHLRRTLVVGHPLLQYKYDAVIWVDDDIFITDPSRDPLYEAIQGQLLCTACDDKFALASEDEVVWHRVPLNSGILALKRGRHSLRFVDEVFRIGRRLQLLGGVWRLPRTSPTSGWWDQDAIAVYIIRHGMGAFAALPHGVLQSAVRPGRSRWRPGDFAAHLTNLAGP